MNATLLITLAFIILTAVPAVYYYFSHQVVVMRKLRSRYTKLSAYENGEITKIIGEVELTGQPLIAPLSGRKCAYYQIIIQRMTSNRKRSWSLMLLEEKMTDFVLRDEEHVAWIDQSKIKSYIVKDVSFESGYMNDPPRHVIDFLTSRGYNSTDFFGFNKSMRFKEGILEEHELVSALGIGVWVDGQSLDLPSKYKKVLAVRAPVKDHVYLSDDPETTKTI